MRRLTISGGYTQLEAEDDEQPADILLTGILAGVAALLDGSVDMLLQLQGRVAFEEHDGYVCTWAVSKFSGLLLSWQRIDQSTQACFLLS